MPSKIFMISVYLNYSMIENGKVFQCNHIVKFSNISYQFGFKILSLLTFYASGKWDLQRHCRPSWSTR
jgi:hypothetical protein